MGKWQETIGHGFGTGRRHGTEKVTEVTNEYTGERGGFQVEHWDDSMDAIITPKTQELKLVSKVQDAQVDMGTVSATAGADFREEN